MTAAQTAWRRLGTAAIGVVALVSAVTPSPAGASPVTSGPGSTQPHTAIGTPALGQGWSPPSPAANTGTVPGRVLVTLDDHTSLVGSPIPGMSSLAARTPHTTSKALDAQLRSVKAAAVRPLFPDLPATGARSLTAAARSRLGSGAVDLSKTFVVDVAEKDSAAAARLLGATPGVAHAEPVRFVTPMNTGAQPLPTPAGGGRRTQAPAARTPSAAPPLAAPAKDLPAPPTNYGLASSTQAYLNAGGVNAVGAFSLLGSTYGQLPGAGETITNVSVGDLTDQAMADGGDGYVRTNGPTTMVKDGQRYLDLPSMPLIPTYVAGPGGTLDPTGSTERQDPALGEVLLDFGVMSPLPHDQQRADRAGSGYTDLLGIAPGAKYRLVVPQQATTDEIAGALLAAAQQSPRPDVITASLGFGTDHVGFPGRYLEDDPVNQAVIAAIVQLFHVVVSVSSNDGTRLVTPVSVGPDGGSTPTDMTSDPKATTSIDDDQYSTTPTKVRDSGAIAAGGTTLDDTLAVPPGSHSALASTGTLAETRISGGGNFSSGFGSRVDLSAPSDGIVVFMHKSRGGPQDVSPVLSGGTSASAPEIAAAAAVVLQAGRLSGRHLTPGAVRALLERTGRPVPTPPQMDRTLHVGPQIDVTAAATAALTGKHVPPYRIVRLSVAHRITAGGLGGTFLEETDQSRIDLGGTASQGTGEGLVGPVTFGADVVGIPAGARPDYVLEVGRAAYHSAVPAVRVTPAQLLTAAGLPLVSTSDRQVTVTFQVRVNGHVQASASRVMTLGPSDGSYAEATAPIVAPVVRAGRPVPVKYDLTGVRRTNEPRLVVSTVGHWNPVLGPIFTAARSYPLTATSGTITLPADAFTGGGGLYGIGIAQSTQNGDLTYAVYGEFAAVRVEGATAADRPGAPTLAAPGGGYGHLVHLTRAVPSFAVHYDVRSVRGAKSALVEISAPGRTIFGALNTFTNANGTTADNDGVNSPSRIRRTIPHTSGTLTLNAVAIGLPTSMSYSVRVLATDGHGKVLGQASPSSFLSLDDGLVPDGGSVLGFTAAGDGSVVALRTPDGGTEVRRYSTTTGEYGPVLTADHGASSYYEIFGVAAGAHRLLLGHRARNGGDLQLETYDTASGALVGTATVRADAYTVVAGRVDSRRDRAAVLAHAVGGGADVLFPIDLATGKAGTPLHVDTDGVAGGTYFLMDIDSSTGDVYLATQTSGLICFKAATEARVEWGTGKVTASPSMPGCGASMASDQNGKVYTMQVRSLSLNLPPTTTLAPLDERTLQPGSTVTVRQGPGLFMAVDGVNHVALVAFPTPAGKSKFGSWTPIITDNNATGQIQVIDLTTGNTVRTLTGFAFTGGVKGFFNSGQERSVQLDPATRTGWTYSYAMEQVQQFSY